MPETLETPLINGGREPKRRKLRKGTLSCWECKRRKIKCVFESSNSPFCVGCKDRGTRCVSQEFPEDYTNRKPQPGTRIDQVEDPFVQLPRNTNKDNSNPQARHLIVESRVNGQKTLGVHGYENEERPRLLLPKPPLDSSSAQNFRGPRSIELFSSLLAAWPSQQDLDIILSASVGISGLSHGVVFESYSQYMEHLPSPQKLLQLPPPGSHPVLIARKLLILSAFLQNLPPVASQKLVGLSTSSEGIQSRAIEASIRLVTSNDELLGSVEGIECLVMESLYHNNGGNLRRAYLTIRRALTIAQMIGLDRGTNCPLLKFLDQETKRRISPEHMWFRILQTDGYLSLMLGLPQGSTDDRFAAPETLDGCQPLERLERILTLAGGRIVRRNRLGLYERKETQEIESLLLQGTNSMPPQWWLAPDIPKAGDDEAVLRETTRLMNQFAHYHLLQRLHLPYVLHPAAGQSYTYSRITAMTASREVLSRFISFRTSQPGAAFFCRGIDFLAFTASTTLCIGHIYAQLPQRGPRSDGSCDDTAALSLALQRPADRGMMERVLERLEELEKTNPTDFIANNISNILRPLLAIEADVANGGSYKTESFDMVGGEELECCGEVSDGGSVLQIYIPHFGTIKIERHGISKAESHAPAESGETMPTTANERGALSPGGYNSAFDFIGEDVASTQWLTSDDDWALQGVDLAFFDNLFSGIGETQ
ncbi:Zn(II)2Cys6 transcription factor [Colletotrichum truncatum]|uniref:Zn(II)2Cys6 transcription factor n=1 Tax=Colletotrichum truncatum TaxID=5467 RepID=A0ACC3YJ78_COLTU|nr:Zn(II)2Cys6 transcription factor [Colletotrichum truncatum]KAF6797212.1 Zn(II)2Cys6 transcription factor [Colletotrichum truncatum]